MIQVLLFCLRWLLSGILILAVLGVGFLSRVLLPAALVAPDSRQPDVLEVLSVFERWEKVGIV